MEAKNHDESPRLIEYIVLCGVKQSALVDYVSKLEESAMIAGLSKEALTKNGLTPQVLSLHPNAEKPDFPLSPNFVDVMNLMKWMNSIAFHWDTKSLKVDKRMKPIFLSHTRRRVISHMCSKQVHPQSIDVWFSMKRSKTIWKVVSVTTI